MAPPLEKARKNPGSVKARVLRAARTLFGQYGFHGTTTRMIAKEVGIDISTLHYHWGDKVDLYEGVLLDITDEMGTLLAKVEKNVKGKPLPQRIENAVADDGLCGNEQHAEDNQAPGVVDGHDAQQGVGEGAPRPGLSDHVLGCGRGRGGRDRAADGCADRLPGRRAGAADGRGRDPVDLRPRAERTRAPR